MNSSLHEELQKVREEEKGRAIKVAEELAELRSIVKDQNKKLQQPAEKENSADQFKISTSDEEGG